MSEVHATVHKSVDVWRMHFWIVDGVDGAVHQVVRDEEEKVGAIVPGSSGLSFGCCSRGGQGGGRRESYKLATIHMPR